MSEHLIEGAFVLPGAYRMNLPYRRVSGGIRGFESLPGKPVFENSKLCMCDHKNFLGHGVRGASGIDF